MKDTQVKWIAGGIATMVIIAVSLIILSYSHIAVASAPSGLSSTVATTGPMAVTTTASTILGTTTQQCAARVISTRESAITLTFSDNQGATPTALFGHIQPASTTVVYDAGLYGCNAIKAYSFTSQNVTVTETR